MERRYTDLSDALAQQAAVDTDDLARRTLGEFAVALSPTVDRAVELADQAVSTEGADGAWREVVGRASRRELLDVVSGPPPRPALLDVLLGKGAHHGDQWTAAEVCRLAEVLAVLPEDCRHWDGVEEVLAHKPLAALAGRLAAPPGEYLPFDVGRLASGWNLEQLNKTVALLSGDGSALAAEARVVLTGRPDPDTVDTARGCLGAAAKLAGAPPGRMYAAGRIPGTERQRARLLAAADRMSSDDVRLLLRQTPAALDDLLDPSRQQRLDATVQAEVARLAEAGHLAQVTTAARQATPLRVIDALTWAAHRGLPIKPLHWVPVALFALHRPDDRLRAWCLQNYDSDLADALSDALARQPAEVVAAAHEIVPGPWAEPLVRSVLNAASALASSPAPLAQHVAARTVASLVKGGAGEAVRSWLPKPRPAWLLPLAVILHDCEAENELLTSLLRDTASILRWPEQPATDWVAAVQCASSADLLEDVVSAALVDGHETNDLRALFTALDRVEGEAVLVRYDRLIADERIPSAPFLYYERQRALSVLLETAARRTLTGPGAETAVLGLTPSSTDGRP